MNPTTSAQSPKFYQIFTRKQFLPTSVGNAQAQLQLLQVTRKRSCTFGMINRGHLELATSPIMLHQVLYHYRDYDFASIHHKIYSNSDILVAGYYSHPSTN